MGTVSCREVFDRCRFCFLWLNSGVEQNLSVWSAKSMAGSGVNGRGDNRGSNFEKSLALVTALSSCSLDFISLRSERDEAWFSSCLFV